MDKTAKEVLKAARNLLSRRNAWMQGDLWDVDKKSFCAIGALDHINGPNERKAIKILAKSIAKAHPSFTREYVNGRYYLDDSSELMEEIEVSDDVPREFVIAYNDTINRKKSDVLKAFDKAIENVGD